MANEIYDYGYPEDDTTYYKIGSDDNAEFEISNDPGWEVSIGFILGKTRLYHTTITKAQLVDLHKLISHVLENVLEVDLDP